MTTPPLIHDDFLLQSPAARELYHNHARGLPIIDYHCHLPPGELAANAPFRDLAHVWLGGDHYKWRALRADGVEERLITGDASPREKFDAWAATVPRLLRNPLYHWTHMELADPFGIRDRLLSPATADFVWNACNERLAEPAFAPRGLVEHFRVEVICTTDDPADDLLHHATLAADATFSPRVLPTFRPDAALGIENPAAWNTWLDRLAARTGSPLRTWDELGAALHDRANVFARAGCRLSDHGLAEPYADSYSLADVRATFAAARAGTAPTPAAARAFRSALLYELGLLYHHLDWTQQYHLGPLRNTNTRALRRLGADAGCDSMGDARMAEGLAHMLDRLDAQGKLTRTILYNLNPADNELFATMAGNFQEGPVPGKIQYGSAWWFLDQKSGIERQLDALSNMGLLARFVGMLTDSRSFLSYPRHDYFRRVLCNVLGTEIEQGLLPRDFALVGGLVRAVCHDNARDYFGFA
ncbi:MAG: glucuronate isomerase [Candidatus Sumerlaeota bacterium]|nr:glucuronate isomerase [Candidatus Sumerlaeota bacterium]